MAFDGIVIKALINELKPYLVGTKINKIFEPTKDEIILNLYNKTNYSLLLSTNPENCRICLTNYSKPNPIVAPNFCMLLRKYLIGSKIIDIFTVDLERTIEIQFESYNELNDLVIRKLFIEIMSRQSNIILTNEKNIIIDTLKHISTANRELLPAQEFKPAPITKQSFIDLLNFNDFLKILNHNELLNLSSKLPQLFIGFSKSFILYTLSFLNISASEYSISDLEKLYLYIKEILNNLDNSKISCVSFDKDYTIKLLTNNENLHFNSFIDTYYFKKEQTTTFVNYKTNLLKLVSALLKKEYKKLENINTKLLECDKMETYKLYGELLTANLYKFQTLPNINCVTLENYYDNNNLINIPLDNSISIKKNIDKFFAKYNKLKNALKIVTEQKKETEKILDYIESIVFSIDKAKTIIDITEIYEEISETFIPQKNIRKKVNKLSKTNKNKEKYMVLDSIEFEGYTIYIGKNNIQNDYISLKLANKNDYWFHTQKIAGSHILLKTNNLIDIPETVFIKCATLAKENSKASLSSNVPVDYCLAKYVKKASNNKPGLVNYTNYKTIFVK